VKNASVTPLDREQLLRELLVRPLVVREYLDDHGDAEPERLVIEVVQIVLDHAVFPKIIQPVVDRRHRNSGLLVKPLGLPVPRSEIAFNSRTSRSSILPVCVMVCYILRPIYLK